MSEVSHKEVSKSLNFILSHRLRVIDFIQKHSEERQGQLKKDGLSMTDI